ncbi:MAG: Hpt domain-containing protein [bacterium]|nr:Hpt domain-containing protein [bacterium]
MALDMQKYKDLYFQEADSFLVQMRTELDALLTHTHESASIKILHRMSHSMKSRSLVMGYEQLGLIGKALEFYFRDIEEGTKVLNAHRLSYIKTIMKAIQSSVDDARNGKPEHDMSSFISEFT